MIQTINGLETFVSGQGQALLFLHGYGGCKETFSYQLNYFSNFYKVYAPDLPGFKKPLPYAYSLDDYVSCIRAFIEATEEKSFYVIAHSFGARILLKMLPHPGLKKIVLTGAAGLKPKRHVSYYLKKWGYKSVKGLFGEKFALKAFKNINKNGISSMPKTNRLSFIKIVNEHLDYKLDEVTVPTLLIFGSQDKETPLYMAKRFNKKIVTSQLVIFDCGHFAFIDKPQQFNIVVKEFLND